MTRDSRCASSVRLATLDPGSRLAALGLSGVTARKTPHAAHGPSPQVNSGRNGVAAVSMAARPFQQKSGAAQTPPRQESREETLTRSVLKTIFLAPSFSFCK